MRSPKSRAQVVSYPCTPPRVVYSSSEPFLSLPEPLRQLFRSQMSHFQVIFYTFSHGTPRTKHRFVPSVAMSSTQQATTPAQKQASLSAMIATRQASKSPDKANIYL